MPRPYRMCLYPLPCFLALAGWLFVYFTSKPFFIVLGLATLATGTGIFFLWARCTRRWPFAEPTTPL